MKLSNKFCEIGRSIAGANVSEFQCRACPDQLVGPIVGFKHNSVGFPNRLPTMKRDDSPLVVLVMESPHKEEFLGEWGPAKGKTGILIRQYIKGIVQRLRGPLSELILVNAIQHQCSLGVATHYHRDEVFLRLWAEGGREDFERRLAQVYRQGDMVLNCCTDSNPKDRRQIVTDAIQSALGIGRIHSGPHPSSWFSTSHRRAVR